MSFLKSLQGVPCRRKKAPRDRGDCGDVTEKRPIWTQRPHFFLFLHHSGFISAHHRASLTETKEDGCINHRACLGQKSPRQRQHATGKFSSRTMRAEPAPVSARGWARGLRPMAVFRSVPRGAPAMLGSVTPAAKERKGRGTLRLFLKLTAPFPEL